MNRCLKLLLSLLASATLFVLTRTTSSSAAEFEPLINFAGSQFAEVKVSYDGISSDTFFYVDVFSQLQAFANFDGSLIKARGSYSEKRVLFKDRDLHNQYHSFAYTIQHTTWTSSQHRWNLASVRAPGPDLDVFNTKIQDYYRYGANKQLVTLQEVRLRSEKMLCVAFSAIFTTTVMDRNGGEWLFSGEFDDEDEEALDRAIAREFEAAYQVTRFYGLVYNEPLLPLFDRFYMSCVGDKLDAFRRLIAT